MSSKKSAKSKQTNIRRPGRPSESDAKVISREDLLDQALITFAERGYDGTSLRELAAEMNISHGLIPSRFGTKENLWREAVDQGMQRLWLSIDASSDADTAEEKLRAVSLNVLLSLWEYPAILQLINQEGTRDTDRLKYILSSKAQTQMRKRSREIIEVGIAHNEFIEVVPEMVFLMIAHGGGATLCLSPLSKKLGIIKKFNDANCKAMATTIVDVVIEGIKVRN